MLILQENENWNLEILPVFWRNQAPDKRNMNSIRNKTDIKGGVINKKFDCKTWKVIEGTSTALPITTVLESYEPRFWSR